MTIDLRESMARAIHERYRKNQKGKKPLDDPAMQPWESLREDLKESNRQQADQIPEKLRVIGCEILPVTNREEIKPGFCPEQVEILARMEHDRWMAEKLAAGWSYAAIRDDVKKRHPCLVPFEHLPEGEKDKDRQAVQAIPDLLALAGFKIHCLEK